MERRQAFEADLAFFYGSNWAENYTVRSEVQIYLDHLREIEKENPYLLVPYIYHLYMGLLSGGQILQAKRSYLSMANTPSSGEAAPGCAVTFYQEKTIKELKKQLRQAVNDLADNLDAETKQAILTESVKVFELNNVVIKSVKGMNQVLVRRAIKVLIAIVLLLLFLFFGCCSTELDIEGDVFDLNMEQEKQEL